MSSRLLPSLSKRGARVLSRVTLPRLADGCVRSRRQGISPPITRTVVSSTPAHSDSTIAPLVDEDVRTDKSTTAVPPASSSASQSRAGITSSARVAPGPGLREFMAESVGSSESSSSEGMGSTEMSIPATGTSLDGDGAAGSDFDAVGEEGKGSFFIETYGCQMNVSDSEVVRAILLEAGFKEVGTLDEAGVVLANTCAIRERAEGRVWDRLKFFASIR